MFTDLIISPCACWIFKEDAFFKVPKRQRGSNVNKPEWHTFPLFI